MQGFPYRLEQRSTQTALIEALSEHLERCLRQRLQAADFTKPLGLATGRTMEPLYAALVRRLNRWPESDLAALRRGWLSFNLDEYLGLQSQDPRSYRWFMDHHLGHPLGLSTSALRLTMGLLLPAPMHKSCSSRVVSVFSCWGLEATAISASTSRPAQRTCPVVW